MNFPNFFFKYRSYTPIPLILILLYQSVPRTPWLWIGLLLVAGGEGIRFWGILYAGGATRTRNVGARRLVVAGPFAYLRNPLYLGNFIIYTGIVFVAGGPWMWQMLVITLAYFTWQYSQIVTLEEDTLSDLFGEEYRDYTRNVPRIIPRLRPWQTGGDKDERLNVRQALTPEKSTLLNITLALAAIAAKWIYLQL